MNTQDHQSDIDPFLCTCGPCKKFWKENFSSAEDILRQSSLSRAGNTATVGNHNSVIKVGDRVSVYGQFPGTVKFVGVVDDNSIAPQLYLGVKLDDNVNSTHNGVYKGKRYFHCPRGHGAMVRYTEVQILKPVEKTPSLNGNYMFPSWEEVKMRRKERYEKLASIYKNAGIDPPSSMVTPTPGCSSQLSSKKDSVIHISDPNDIGLKDKERKAEKDRKRIESYKQDRERFEMKRLKSHFEGQPNADQLAQTLLKLKQAYNDGLALTKRRTTWDMESEKHTDDEDY